VFVEKVRDIVGLYLNPPDKAMVLCVDEKSQTQALEHRQPILPLHPGALLRSEAEPANPPFIVRRQEASVRPDRLDRQRQDSLSRRTIILVRSP
jgi:hypothetical protein